MIPILYEGTETSFTTNGLGRLADAISCKVVEEINSVYELEMTYPVDGVHYEDIHENRIILAQPFDGGQTQPFLIYKVTKPINGIVTINAEHISYRLTGITVMPYTASSATAAIAGVKTNSAITNPFDFSTDKSVTASFALAVPKSAREILCGSSGSILDIYGKGDYEFNRFNVFLWQNRGSNNGVTLRYGKNITDLTSVVDMSSVYTGICPYWADGNGNTVTLTEKVVMSGHENLYPYKIIKAVDFSADFDDQPTENQLRARAQSYVANNEGWKLKNNITVSFVALWNTEEYKDIAPLERVKMCDIVHVIYSRLGVDFTTRVIKTDYDVLMERYNSISLGDAPYSINKFFEEEIVQAQEEQMSTLQKAINHATELITGGLGGHIVFNMNADGQPQEMLIMDTDSIQTAINVLRINKNGIGFSTNGYNGPFSTAWTIDSHFNADYIDTGTLTANLIKAGIIEDAAGINYWDMTTGEFRLTSAAKIGNNTFSQIFTALEGQIAGKITTFYQASAPTANVTGDLWIDTDDGNKLYRWNGSAWTSVQDAAIQSALTAASNAQTTADGKIVTFAQASAPTATDVGDLWIDTDDNNKMYRWDGSSWVAYTDTSALNAFVNGSYATFVTNTNTAIAGKITTFYQASAPTANVTGDLWIDTDDGNKLYRWNGSEWTSVQDAAIQSALTAASNAQTTADGKIVTFAQASAPTATDVGDLWIDTDDNNKLYRWSGSAWVAYTDTSGIAAYDATLDQAEIFDRLTDGGEVEGIYMEDGQLYINASYIATGTLTDASGNTTWNLSTGALHSEKFSVTSENFTLDEQGNITATGATINGEFETVYSENASNIRSVSVKEGQFVLGYEHKNASGTVTHSVEAKMRNIINGLQITTPYDTIDGTYGNIILGDNNRNGSSIQVFAGWSTSDGVFLAGNIISATCNSFRINFNQGVTYSLERDSTTGYAILRRI